MHDVRNYKNALMMIFMKNDFLYAFRCFLVCVHDTVYASSRCLTVCFLRRACLSSQSLGVTVRFVRG